MRRAALRLRPAADDDLPFLRNVYAATRSDEMAMVPWSDTAKARFVEAQFALQHDDFVARFAAADFLIVSSGGKPVGRLYLDRTGPMWRVIDIALVPEVRGSGTGTALLRWLQRAARRAKASGIELHVLHSNQRAARLYASLGFDAVMSSFPTHGRMVWSTAPATVS